MIRAMALRANLPLAPGTTPRLRPGDSDDVVRHRESSASVLADMARGLRTASVNARVVAGMYTRRLQFAGPRILQIRVPATCDHHCVFCISLSSESAERRSGTATFDYDRCLRLMDRASELGTLKFNLCSLGETLLFPKLKPLILHIRDASRGAAVIKLVTHGTAIADVGIDFFLENRTHFWLSLHGGDFETWHRIHRSDASDPRAQFDRLRRSIRALTSSRRCPVTLHNVVSVHNYDKLAGILDFALETGVRDLSFTAVRGFSKHMLGEPERARLRAELPALRRAMRKHGVRTNLGSFVLDLASEDGAGPRHWAKNGSGFYNTKRCYIGWLMTFVDVDGRIVPCCRGKELGNIDRDDFADVWHGPYAEFRRRSVSIASSGPPPGYDCEHCSHVGLNEKANRLVRF